MLFSHLSDWLFFQQQAKAHAASQDDAHRRNSLELAPPVPTIPPRDVRVSEVICVMMRAQFPMFARLMLPLCAYYCKQVLENRAPAYDYRLHAAMLRGVASMAFEACAQYRDRRAV